MFTIFPWFSILFEKSFYLDPGSGSFLIQMAIAALVGIAFLVRSQWGRIKKMFGGKTSKPEDEESDNQDDEQ
jgi:hypothetical protein